MAPSVPQIVPRAPGQRDGARDALRAVEAMLLVPTSSTASARPALYLRRPARAASSGARQHDASRPHQALYATRSVARVVLWLTVASASGGAKRRPRLWPAEVGWAGAHGACERGEGGAHDLIDRLERQTAPEAPTMARKQRESAKMARDAAAAIVGSGTRPPELWSL